MHLLLVSLLELGADLSCITSVWCQRAAAHYCMS